MPLPKPKPEEEQKEFINRCMTDNVMAEEYKNKTQRLAVCYIQWRKGS